jgi:hypothetical protein
MILTGENRNTEEKNPVPVPLYPPRTSHELAWYRTLTCGDRRTINSLSSCVSCSYLVAVVVEDEDRNAGLFNLLTSGVADV